MGQNWARLGLVRHQNDTVTVTRGHLEHLQYSMKFLPNSSASTMSQIDSGQNAKRHLIRVPWVINS